MEKEIAINKYINGELSGSALTEFETLLKKNKDLQKEIEFHKQVDHALRINEEVESNKNLKSLLSDLGKTHIQGKTVERGETITKEKNTSTNPELLPKTNSRLKKLSPYFMLAAAAALLLFLFFPALQNKSNVELAESNFQLYELNDDVMGVDNQIRIYKAAKMKYVKSNFKAAKNQFAAYLKTEPNVPKAWLAKGCAEFKLDDLNAALLSFQKAIETDESGIYHANAYWYLALTNLKKDETDKAKYQLQSIQKDQDYFEEAQKLLRQL